MMIPISTLASTRAAAPRSCALLAMLGLFAIAACGRITAEEPAAKAVEQAVAEAGELVQPSIIVRFREPHPLARAQALEAAEQCDAAARLARESLAAQPALAGLCFDRFTVGGAEIVLQACVPVPAAEADAFQNAWVLQLNAMDDVEYAEPNAVAASADCA